MNRFKTISELYKRGDIVMRTINNQLRIVDFIIDDEVHLKATENFMPSTITNKESIRIATLEEKINFLVLKALNEKT